MSEKMLIDASHPEETRVVVVRGNRIEEFDFESQHKKQLRGNIYLAKVTRVEPSLQAAFVDYGGNRHGFLAFSEIHPDYYQIPLADRQALLAEEAEEARQELEDDEDEKDSGRKAKRARKTDAENEEDGGESRPRRARRSRRKKKDEDAVAETAPEANDASPAGDAAPEAAEAASGAETDDAPSAAASEPAADAGTADENTAPDHELSADDADASGSDAGEPEADDTETDEEDGDDKPGIMSAIIETDSISEPVDRRPGGEDEDAPAANGDDSDDDEDEDGEDDDNGDGRKAKVESVGSEDALEEVPDRTRRKPRKQYRIQEVIKRRQILLVQVVKEERGNKGAALTTYLSLAGRYSVLMPNTARGGGISRKITNVTDRKRLKEVARELEVPQGMGVILRTAGANRTKVEIKRDFEYLMRLWDTVRTLTLKSTAPCLVYEEGSLIKRSIRDLYNKNISEVIVSGEEGYREAKDFMKMLMPSHAKVVQPYKELMPIFARSGIDAQLDKMVQPQVTLKSGGYIIINQTEALVAIDVNSGRSTREHSIEDTALQTNLEAAEEVARQLRLRDLAGLIVIDFIDMEENRNNRSVEKKLKECLKNDRARIQVGRISHFGLLEMSRQRIRASVLESTMQVCAHCGGTGHVRSPSSVALHVLRGVEEYLLKHTTHHITVRTTGETALYMLNNKRDTIMEMENRFGLSITFASDPDVGSQYFAVDRGLPVENPVSIEHIHANSPSYDEEEDVDVPEIEDEEETAATAGEEDRERDGEDGGRNKRRRRRRRRGRRGGREENEARFDDDNADQQDAEDEDRSETVAASGEAEDEGEDGQPAGKKRRRGKRGGRKNRDESRASDEGAGESAPLASDDEAEASSSETEAPAEEAPLATAAADAPSPAVSEEATPDAETTAETEAAPAEKPKRPRRGRKKAAEAETTGAADAETELDVAAAATAPVMAETTEAEAEAATTEAEGAEADDADGRPKRDRKAQTDLSAIASAPVVTSSSAGDEEEAKEKPKKAGWWQRRGFL